MSNHFEGVPMKVIVDLLTSEMVEEFKLYYGFFDAVDYLMFRCKIDTILWRVKEQAKEYMKEYMNE